MKHRQTVLLQKRLAALFARKNRRTFDMRFSLSIVHILVLPRLSMPFLVVGIFLISLHSKGTLNAHSSFPHSSFHCDLQSTITDMDISEVCFSEDDVLQGLN